MRTLQVTLHEGTFNNLVPLTSAFFQIQEFAQVTVQTSDFTSKPEHSHPS